MRANEWEETCGSAQAEPHLVAYWEQIQDGSEWPASQSWTSQQMT